MKEFKTQPEVFQNLDFKEVICNMCGLTCAMTLDAAGEFQENEGLIEAKVSGGYPSTPGNGDGALDDCVEYTFSLCEFCLDFIFSNFINPPKVNDSVKCKITLAFVPADIRVAKDNWRAFKQEFYQRKSERDLARKIKRK